MGGLVMDTLVYRAGGLDVHKKFIAACTRLTDPQTGKVTEHTERFGTMTADLHRLAEWMAGAGVTHVAMESTGVYWKPVWNILEDRFQLMLVNPRELKQVPGRKSDERDCRWIAHLLACGLLTASFVPPRGQRELRDLTRQRACLLNERTRVANRVQKLLEDANVKLASVASDIFGKSGRDMLDSLRHGQTDIEALAELARGQLRGKIPQLKAALAGKITEHHRFLLGQLLDHFDHLNEHIVALDERIAEVLRPFVNDATLARLDASPGVNRRTIENVVAEIGVDMTRFPTAGHLCSWAGVCPGNEESAGKRKRAATTHGNHWLRRALGEAGRAAARKKDSYFKAQYHRLAARRGANRAVVAVAHALLVIFYHLLANPELTYQDLGANHFDKLQPERMRQQLVKRLEALGYHVNLTPHRAA
jgi:transposase